MSTPNLSLLTASPSYQRRAERLTAELRVALAKLDRRQLFEWGSDAARMSGHVIVRRGLRLGKTVVFLGRGAAAETSEAIDSVRQGNFARHVKARGEAFFDTVRATSKRVRQRATQFASMARNPEQLPEAVVTVIAALVSSGGLDANGGIPDLDLQFGIEAHRSIFTHSIIAGTVVEGSLYSIATLVGMTYRHLPSSHDPLWDTIDRNRDRFLAAVATGASAGIAYHLLIDGTLQPGTYHDLPAHLPLAGHGGILVANAAAEAVDVPMKSETFRQARHRKA